MAEKLCKREIRWCARMRATGRRLVVLALHRPFLKSLSLPRATSCACHQWGSSNVREGTSLASLSFIRYPLIICQGTESVPVAGLGSDTGDQVRSDIYNQIDLNKKCRIHLPGLTRRQPHQRQPRPHIFFSMIHLVQTFRDPRLDALEFWRILVPAALKVENNYSV